MAEVVHLERIDLMDGMLENVNQHRKISTPTIYRPSRSLTLRHPKQFSPRYIALGLYNPDIDVRESACATIDRNKLQVKLEIAHVFKTTVKKSWPEICRSVVKDHDEMKNMYEDCPIHDVQAIVNILTLDAVFVTCILYTLWDVHSKSDDPHLIRFQEISTEVQERGLSKGNTGVLLDILAILQNQVPFKLLRNVVELMCQPLPAGGISGPMRSDEARIVLNLGEISMNGHNPQPVVPPSPSSRMLNNMVEVACGLMMYNLPGRVDKPMQSPPLETADYSHLLDCVYKTALQYTGVETWEWPKDTDDTHPIATATQLKKSGINIIRGAENISGIRFQRGIIAATLILPPLRITPWTETLLRNLVAYESRVLKKGDLMCFISFMDQLIDTKEDVFLLKEKKLSVIEISQLSSDLEVANIFNTLLQNSNDVPLSKKWADLRKDIHRFYNSERRQLWVEFYDIHFGRPWITGSVVAAIALLALTFLQTLYTLKAYYEGGGGSSLSSTTQG